MPSEHTTTGQFTIVTERITFDSGGDAHVINITEDVRSLLRSAGVTTGAATIFVPGATGALTTLEFEPGVVADFQGLFDRVAPVSHPYEHNLTHPDMNGHAHVRAGLLGPSLVVPFEEATLCLGTWQEICFVCFDNRPRKRTVIVQLAGIGA